MVVFPPFVRPRPRLESATSAVCSLTADRGALRKRSPRTSYLCQRRESARLPSKVWCPSWQAANVLANEPVREKWSLMIRCDKSTRFDLPSSPGRAKAAMRTEAYFGARVLGRRVPVVRPPTPSARVGDIGGVLARRGRRFSQHRLAMAVASSQSFARSSSAKRVQNQLSLPTPGKRPPSKRSLVSGAAGC